MKRKDATSGYHQRLYAAGIAEATALTLAGTINTLYFTTILGFSVASVGIAFSLASVAGFVIPVPVGGACDRFGARRVVVWVLSFQAIAFCVLIFVRSYVALLVCLVALIAAQRASSSARSTLVADTAGKDARARAMIRMRATMFIGSALGSGLAFLTVAIASAASFRWALLACALICVAIIVLIAPLPAVARAPGARASTRAAIRDVRYLSVAAASSLVGLHDSLVGVGIPLVVVQYLDIPKLVVPIVVLASAGLTALCQNRFGANVASLRDAIGCHWRSVALLAPAAVLLMAGAKHGGTAGAGMLIVAALVATAAAMMHASGAIYLGYELADDRYLASYLAVFGLGRTLQLTIGPVLVTVTVVQGGWLGCALFVALISAAPLLVAQTTRWAAVGGPNPRAVNVVGESPAGKMNGLAT
jgi:MFS family permease